MITLLRSMSCNAKEWINIDHYEVRLYSLFFITLELFSRVVLVSRSLLGNISAPFRVHITPLALSKHHVTLETVNNS